MAIRKADKTNWYINDSFVCWDERVSNWFCGECWRYGCSHVQELREHLTKRVPDLATPCENHILYVACGYKYCPNCGNPLGG